MTMDMTVSTAVNAADHMESYVIQQKYKDFNYLLIKQLECLRIINHQLSQATTPTEPLYIQKYEFIKPIIEEYKTILGDFESVCALRDKFLEKHPEPECTFIKSTLKEIYKHFYCGPHEDHKENYLDHLNRVINY